MIEALGQGRKDRRNKLVFMEKKNKTYILKESDIKKMKKEIVKEVSKTSIYIFLAWLKEEKIVENDPEKLLAEYERLEQWFGAIDEHLISLRDIQKIIEDGTNLKVKVK